MVRLHRVMQRRRPRALSNWSGDGGDAFCSTVSDGELWFTRFHIIMHSRVLSVVGTHCRQRQELVQPGGHVRCSFCANQADLEVRHLPVAEVTQGRAPGTVCSGRLVGARHPAGGGRLEQGVELCQVAGQDGGVDGGKGGGHVVVRQVLQPRAAPVLDGPVRAVKVG